MTIQSDREWCVRACRWLPAIAGVAALLSLVPEALSPGPYFYDQNYCLQAAVRLAHGQGLTGCSDHEPPPLEMRKRSAQSSRHRPGRDRGRHPQGG